MKVLILSSLLTYGGSALACSYTEFQKRSEQIIDSSDVDIFEQAPKKVLADYDRIISLCNTLESKKACFRQLVAIKKQDDRASLELLLSMCELARENKANYLQMIEQGGVKL